MATVIETEQAATLKLKVETGTTDSGAAKYATRSIAHINPEIAKEDAYDIGSKLAALQNCPLSAIQMVESKVLTEEG